MHISYGEVEDFLAEIHRVAPEKRIALRGRLKHFQRLGWPAGTNQGKGARVRYGVGQTLSLAMGFELLQLGLTPERVVSQFRLADNMLAGGFVNALREYGSNPDPIYYIFTPESLSALRGEEFNELSTASFMISQSKLPNIMRHGSPFQTRRFAFVNLEALLSDYINHFIDKGLGSPENLKVPLENWHQKTVQDLDHRMQKMISDLDDGNS